MHIGHLKHQEFVNSYKKLGFSTRNQMMDAALELLKNELAKQQREEWRTAAHEDYTKSKVDYIWEPLDGEDFETI